LDTSNRACSLKAPTARKRPSPARSNRDTGKEQIVGAGAVVDGEPSTAATVADGGPDAPEEDPDYKPGREAGVEEVSAEDEVAV